MPEPTITRLPHAPLHALEIWSDPRGVAERMAAALDLTLPAIGQAITRDRLTLIRFEPTLWWAEGDGSALQTIVGRDGALAPIGGGIVRVRVTGRGWRTLLMEGGLFDAESAAFAPGCCAATIIDHVAIRLRVESGSACLAYVPASYAPGLIEFWQAALPLIATDEAAG